MREVGREGGRGGRERREGGGREKKNADHMTPYTTQFSKTLQLPGSRKIGIEHLQKGIERIFFSFFN